MTDISKSSNTATTQQIALPDWDATEINRRLEENAKFLHEWSTLLDKTGNFGSCSVRLCSWFPGI